MRQDRLMKIHPTERNRASVTEYAVPNNDKERRETPLQKELDRLKLWVLRNERQIKATQQKSEKNREVSERNTARYETVTAALGDRDTQRKLVRDKMLIRLQQALSRMKQLEGVQAVESTTLKRTLRQAKATTLRRAKDLKGENKMQKKENRRSPNGDSSGAVKKHPISYKKHKARRNLGALASKLAELKQLSQIVKLVQGIKESQVELQKRKAEVKELKIGTAIKAWNAERSTFTRRQEHTHQERPQHARFDPRRASPREFDKEGRKDGRKEHDEENTSDVF